MWLNTEVYWWEYETMEPMTETPLNMLPSLLPNRSGTTVFMCDPGTLTPVFKFHPPPFSSWFILLSYLVSLWVFY